MLIHSAVFWLLSASVGELGSYYLDILSLLYTVIMSRV